MPTSRRARSKRERQNEIRASRVKAIPGAVRESGISEEVYLIREALHESKDIWSALFLPLTKP
jgi:hypothetical protein